MIEQVRAAADGLVLDGVPADELAEAYGTPVFAVLDERLEANVEALRSAFDGWGIYYAVKANPLQHVLRVIREAGLGAEVMSAMERAFVDRAGFAPERVIFNGPAKSDDEIRDALDAGIRIHLDNLPEAERVAELAEPGTSVAVRIHPDLPDEIEKRAYISKKTKLGLDPDLGAKTYRVAAERGLDPDGLHIHVGTDQSDPLLHEAVAGFAAGYLDRLADDGIAVGRVNLGGGLASRIDLDADLDAFAGAMTEPLGGVDLELEPGRVLVGDAVACVTRVRRVKKTWGKTWVLVDAGANTLIPLRYTSYRTVSHRAEPDEPVDVGGPLCLPVDVVEGSAYVAPEVGDLVVVLNAGAYTLTMAETFGQPRPAVAAVRDGDHARVRRRETVEDHLSFEEETPW